MKRVLLIFLIIFTGISSSNAQREFNVWTFGHSAGIDFNGMDPVPYTDNNIESEEGCSSVCDRYGKLLFYSNNEKIWNSEHNIMVNGDGLLGNSSASQAPLIVPKPGNNMKYYVFTIDEQGQEDGLRYTVVDMALQGGLGEVIEKNVLVHTPTSEKLTALTHSNGEDIWVLSHDMQSNAFRALLLTHDGIGETVLSPTGYTHQIYTIVDSNNTPMGQMKFNDHGTRLAIAVDSVIQLFDFDNSTGKVSNPMTITPLDVHTAYGIEFSPDATKLYVTNLSYQKTLSRLTQYDLSIWDEFAINSSEQILYEFENVRNTFGAVQIAPDKKIYVAVKDAKYLAVINNPNGRGDACDFQIEGFFLDARSWYGLPGKIQTSETKINIYGPAEKCENDSMQLSCSSIDAIEFKWYGPNNFYSEEQNPVIYDLKVKMSGTYKCILTYKDKYVDSSSVDVYVQKVYFDNINQPDFEPLPIGERDYREIQYKNSSEFEIIIDAPKIHGNENNTFQFVDMAYDFPYTMQPEEVVTFKIQYYPVEVRDYIDSISIEVVSPCYLSDTEVIEGIGLTRELYVWLPHIETKLEKEICFDVMAVLECDTNIKYRSEYNIEIRHDVTAFLPESGINMVDNYIDGDERVIVIESDSVDFSSDTISLATICGKVYLGDEDRTVLKLSAFNWPDTLITVEKNRIHIYDGSIAIEPFCQSNLSRVSTLFKSSVQVSPNPVTDYVEITSDCRQTGAYSIEIFNLNGISVKKINWQVDNDDNLKQEHLFNIDMSGYSTGLYQLNFRCPNEIITKQIAIIK